jgi:four helix bundle protein
MGANLEETQASLTRREFTHKVSLAPREAREKGYWMRRVERNKLSPAKRLSQLSGEWNELVSILTAVLRKLRATT